MFQLLLEQIWDYHFQLEYRKSLVTVPRPLDLDHCYYEALYLLGLDSVYQFDLFYQIQMSYRDFSCTGQNNDLDDPRCKISK